MPEPLDAALAALRPLLLDVDTLIRAVAAGQRHGARPEHVRAELRPVDLKAGRLLQVVTTDGRVPTTRNHSPGPDAAGAVDALLDQPFGNWHVETIDRAVQLRVTKRGAAQVHTTARPARTERTEPVPHDRIKQRLIDPADPLFDVLGADGGKRRQVDAFARQLAAVLARASRGAASERRPLHVVDLGCGNAYLTFAAHRYLIQAMAGVDGVDSVRTVGVDVRPDLVARNEKLAAQLELPGLRFVAGAIEDADPGLEPVDLVLALHACDTATDDALARAVRWQAGAILAAPCCHHDIQRQLTAGKGAHLPFPALTRHAILRERFADVLTDALRADVLRLLGYRVDVVEFVDSRHTPRNALLRAERTGVPADEVRRAELADLAGAWHVEPRLAALLRPELGGTPP